MTPAIAYLVIAAALYLTLPEEPPDYEFHPIHWYAACLMYALLWPISLTVLLIARLLTNTPSDS